MWQVIQSACVSIAVVGAAIAYIYKAIKFAKKPADDVFDKLDNDNRRLNNLEKSFDYLTNSNSLILKILFIVLGELAVDNDKSGKIAKAQNDIQEFLINN